MGLSWNRFQPIDSLGLSFPYTHWWRNHEALILDEEAQKRAFRAAAAMIKHRSPPGRAMNILANIPFDEAVPALLDKASLNPDPVADFIPLGLDHTTLKPGDAVVAAIDDGAFPAHEKFRDPCGAARLAWVWLQGATRGGKSELACGRELQSREIDRLIRKYRRGDVVDEESLYREIGLIDMRARHPQSAARRMSHGMAVLDLLTGQGGCLRPAWPNKDGQQQSGILHVLWVGLPPRVTHDTSGTFIPLFVMMALHAVLKRARELLGRRPDLRIPVTVNMSYGLTAGPRDGRSLLGRYVEEQLAEWDLKHAPLSFFVPTGNNRLTQSCARIRLDNEGPLYWHLPPDDPTPSFIEIWGQERTTRPELPGLGLVVTPPNSAVPIESPTPDLFDSFSDLVMDGGEVAMRIYSLWVPTKWDPLNLDVKGPGRECLLVAAQPTRPRGPGRTFVRPGRWEIAPIGDNGQMLDISVQRDDSLPGYPREGRQSWLEDRIYRQRDLTGRPILNDPASPGPIRREGTFNAIAAGPSTNFVAGLRWDGSDCPPRAAYSGLGREHFGEIAEKTPAWPWLTVAGARSGSRVQVRGTSFAAPQAARKVTLAQTVQDDSSTSNA